MKIIHHDIEETLNLLEDNAQFKIESQGKSHLFKDLVDACWFAIEHFRALHIQHLDELSLAQIAKQSNIACDDTKTLLVALRHERISRSFYDQTLLKIISAFRSGASELILNPNQNFIVSLEIQHFLRKHFGQKQSIAMKRW